MHKLILFILFSCVSINTIAEEISQQGRYQIMFSPHVRADTFLLDTWTGKTWKKIHMADIKNDPSVWVYIEKIDSEHDEIEWLKNQVFKTP